MFVTLKTSDMCILKSLVPVFMPVTCSVEVPGSKFNWIIDYHCWCFVVFICPHKL